MVNVDQSILKRGYSANYQLAENMVTVILTSFIEAIIRHLKITGGMEFGITWHGCFCASVFIDPNPLDPASQESESG